MPNTLIDGLDRPVPSATHEGSDESVTLVASPRWLMAAPNRTTPTRRFLALPSTGDDDTIWERPPGVPADIGFVVVEPRVWQPVRAILFALLVLSSIIAWRRRTPLGFFRVHLLMFLGLAILATALPATLRTLLFCPTLAWTCLVLLIAFCAPGP